MSEGPIPIHCCVCGQRLKDPRSVATGMGKICAHRVQGDSHQRRAKDPSRHAFLMLPLQEGIVLKRETCSGWSVVQTNVPVLVVHHSPTGFEFGYAGSGPADLALNILEAVLNRLGYKGDRTTCFQSSCFSLAYRLHQAFKVAFIANAPREGTVIRYSLVEDWVREKIPAERPFFPIDGLAKEG